MDAKINLEDLSSTNPKVKFACSKQAMELSKSKPAELYPDFNIFVKLLDNPNNIMKWTGIIVIGNLSKVDSKNKVDKLLPRFFELLNEGRMITAGNTALALWVIAENKPQYANKIIEELLKVEKYDYQTSECRKILIGKVLFILDKMIDKISNNKEVLKFIQNQTRSSRNATKKRAEALLKKIAKRELKNE